MVSSFNFEALKSGFSQNSKGYVLRLIVHPNDIPQDLVRAPNNQRYMVAMVPMTDDETPIETITAQGALIRAGILCRSKAFQVWLYRVMGIMDVPYDEAFTVELVHKALKIKSRVEIRDNTEARDRFFKMEEAYNKTINNKAET